MHINNFFKFKKIILSFLFVAITFNVTHSFAFELVNQNDHTSSIQSLIEFEEPSEHNDLCDLHHEFHNYYTFDQTTINTLNLDNSSKLTLNNRYFFKLSQSLLKPPTA